MLDSMKTALSLLLLLPILASCGSGGLFNMSEDWCQTHVHASEARCGTHQERMATRTGQSSTDSDVRTHD
jgi:hypothetical protein